MKKIPRAGEARVKETTRCAYKGFTGRIVERDSEYVGLVFYWGYLKGIRLWFKHNEVEYCITIEKGTTQNG